MVCLWRVCGIICRCNALFARPRAWRLLAGQLLQVSEVSLHWHQEGEVVALMGRDEGKHETLKSCDDLYCEKRDVLGVVVYKRRWKTRFLAFMGYNSGLYGSPPEARYLASGGLDTFRRIRSGLEF